MLSIYLKKKHLDDDSGTSLIEVLVGIAILVLVSVALFSLFDFTLRVLWENKARLGAQAIANQHIELARNLPYSDVGTVGGIPSGTIDAVKNVTLNKISYTVKTAVIYIDDPFDGTLGGDPNDSLPTDYKRIRVEISWPFRLSSKPVVFLSDIAPNGIESETGGGTLRITAINASGLPVPQANVHIENNLLDPQVNVDLLTNDNGQVILPGALASVEGYEVTVTKSGYSTDKTYSVDPINLPTPIKPHLTVVEGSVTDSTFSIDVLSDVNVFAYADVEYTPGWWDENYRIRRRLTIQNNSTVDTMDAGYTVSFDFDHYNQVQQGDSLASGDDVRILWYTGSAWQELNRVNTTDWNNSSSDTVIRFKTQSSISPSGSDNNYFIYYGNNSPGAVLNDAKQVYQFYDDFSDEAYTYANWATSTDTWVVQGGEYRQTSTGVSTHAITGPTFTDFVVEADVRSASSNNDVGLMGRFTSGGSGSDNFYVGKPSVAPTAIGSIDNNTPVFGTTGTFIQATDTTLALAILDSGSSQYSLMASSDDGDSWTGVWSYSANSSSEFSHGMSYDASSNMIFYVFSEYDSSLDQHQLVGIPFSYDSVSMSWTAGTKTVISANSFAERPFNPDVMIYNGTIWVSYVRADSYGYHEVAVRSSSDMGLSWSSETFLSDWNTTFSDNQERKSLSGKLVVYGGQIVSVLNGARNAGWRTYNGSSWSPYASLLTNTFHNNAFSVVSDTSNLHLFYRHAGDSGRPHQYTYNGTTWSDNAISNKTINYSLSASYVSGNNKLFVLFGTPNDDTAQLYVTSYESGVWIDPEPISPSVVPIHEVYALNNQQKSGISYMVYVGGPNGSRTMYAHRIGLAELPGASSSVVAMESGGSFAPLSNSVSSFVQGTTYRVRAILYDTFVTLWNDDTMIFQGDDNTLSQGQFGLYANNTEAYYDNVLARLYVRPEPTVSGSLEEVLESSQPLPNLPVLVRGAKIIGYDGGGDPVYKYSESFTTDSNGQISLTSIEWDAYSFYVSDSVTGYDLAGVDPPDPVSVSPGTTSQVNLYFVADDNDTLRVTVLDVDNQPIQDAQVRAYNTNLSYDTTIDTLSYGQSFFTPLVNATYGIEVDKTGYIQGTDSVDVSGSSTLSIILTEEGSGPPPGNPPLAPTLGSFTNVAETSMTVNWTDNATDEDGYKIYRNTSSSKPANEIVTLGADSELYPATGLTCDTTYYWWVEAYNSSGSNDDNGSQATITCPTPPASPTMQAFSDVEQESMTVNWTDNASNEDGYRVYRNTSNTKPGSPISTLSSNTQTYTATGLTCDTTYYWWVEAYNAQGTADDTDSNATLSCPSGVLFSDTFTEGSNTTLSSHTPDTGSGWTQIIEISWYGGSTLRVHSNSDQLRKNSCQSNEGALYRTNDMMTGPDYEVRVTQINGDTGNDYNFLAARIVDANNMYAFKWNETRGQLYKRVSGTWTELGSQISGSGTPLNDGSTITLKVDGNNISVIDDGDTLISVTDNTFTSAGYAGIGMGALVGIWDDCSSQRLDNFEVEVF